MPFEDLFKPEIIGGRLQFDHGMVQNYLTTAATFHQYLCMAIFLTSGTPPRGTELLAARWRNLPGMQRDFYVEDGGVMMCLHWEKPDSVRNGNRVC